MTWTKLGGQMPTIDVNRLLRDAGYTAVGLGILTFQRAQVRRRALERAVREATVVPEEIVRWAIGLPERDRPWTNRSPPCSPARDSCRPAHPAGTARAIWSLQ